jgi:hypothetical protein
MNDVGRYDVVRIFDLYTRKARYELKVVLLHLWRAGGFINTLLADLSQITFRDNNIRIQ